MQKIKIFTNIACKLKVPIVFIFLYLIISTQAFAQSQIKGMTEDTANNVINKVTSVGTSAVTSYLGSLFPTVEVEASSGLTKSVTGSILVVSPLSDPKNIYNTIFMQGSIFLTREDRYRETVNIGLGDRYLLMDKKLLVGVNAFYDHEFPYDHRRGSLGFEARSSVGELNANKYYRLSGWSTGYNSLKEKPMDGQDIELGIPLPYLNWAKIYAKNFKWEGSVNSSDLKGNQYTLKAALPYGFSIEGGVKDYRTAGVSNENFLKLSWNSNPSADDQKTLTASNEAYTLTSMEDRRYDKVRRENLIVKEKSGIIIRGF